jgi:hypothetical protein
MSNKTVEEVIAAVGRPTSISAMASGQTLLQWQATGCHMALLFGVDGRFVKITHQYAAFAAAPKGCMKFVVVAVAFALVSLASRT